MSIIPVTFDAKNPNVGVVHTETEQGALLYTNSLSPLLDKDVKWITVPENHPFAAGRRVNKMNPAILGHCPMCQQSGCIEAQTDSYYTNADGEQVELMVLHCITKNQFAFT